MKSLQGLILDHLQGATCSTAIIGMDGTATIGREGKRGEQGRGRERWLGWSERERKKEWETSWREDKDSKRGGVKLMQMMTLSVLQQVNEDENK